MLDEEHIDWEREKEMIQRQIWDQGEQNKAPCCSSPLCACAVTFKQIISGDNIFYFCLFHQILQTKMVAAEFRVVFFLGFWVALLFLPRYLQTASSISIRDNVWSGRTLCYWEESGSGQTGSGYLQGSLFLYFLQMSPSNTKRSLSFPGVRGQI